MKKKVSVKKTGAVSVQVKTKRQDKSAAKRRHNYLDAKFTTRLIEHMHRAKKAALRNKG